jgi:uncharacterized protein YqgV (UPF0045/DUF77 family)
MRDCTVEFFIEPFNEDAPGSYVMAGIEAMEARDLHVTMGPFGSTVKGTVSDVSDGIGAMVSAAADDGAHRVRIEVTIDQS